MARFHIAMFSQTGGEIYEISKRLKRLPDLILFNSPGVYASKHKPINMNTDLINVANDRMIMMPTWPTKENYREVFRGDELITLHGWLRVIPSEICEHFEIYNGHPGLISEHPELKGKDPQAKAKRLGLKESGCVIHRVTPNVDEGEILYQSKVNIEKFDIVQTIDVLHNTSVTLWTEFLKEKLCE